MHVAIAIFALAASSAPSAGLTASFASGLQLTLGDDNGPPQGSVYPPPPPLVETPPLPKEAAPTLPPPPLIEVPDLPEPRPQATSFPPPPLPQAPRTFFVPKAPPEAPGSIPAAFWESYAADLGLRLVFEGVSLLFLALAIEELDGCTPNPVAGALLLIPGIAALIGQPFAMAGIVGSIFHGERLDPHYWTSFAYDVFFTLIVGPAAGLLFGELASLATNNSDNSTAEVAVGITAFALAGAFGGPVGAYASLPSPPPAQPAVPVPHAALGVPLVHFSFN